MSLFRQPQWRLWSRPFVGAAGLIVAAGAFAGAVWEFITEAPSPAAVTQRADSPLRSTAAPTRNALAEAIGFDIAAGNNSPVLTLATRGSGEVTNSDWAERLADPGFWSNMKRQKSNGTGGWSGGQNVRPSGLTKDGPTSLPNGLQGRSSPVFNARENNGSTYRTMCVRLCDGFYWPVSFATTKDNFEKDEQTCQASCGGAKNARLFSYPNPGGSTDDLEDDNGVPYKKLPNAFAFRTTYNDSCKCRAHPWEEQALDQHKIYALESKDPKKNPGVKAEIEALRKKMSQAGGAAAAPGKQSQRANGDTADIVAANAPATMDPARRMSRAPRAAQSFVSKQAETRIALPAATLIRPTASLRRDLAPVRTTADAPSVRIRLGAQPPVEVQVERSSRPQRGADAGETRGLKPEIVRR